MIRTNAGLRIENNNLVFTRRSKNNSQPGEIPAFFCDDAGFASRIEAEDRFRGRSGYQFFLLLSFKSMNGRILPRMGLKIFP